MTINIPDSVKDFMKDNTNNGDYTNISRAICGDDTKRMRVRQACLNGRGNDKVVKAIVKFYKSKQKTLSQIA